MKRVRFIPHAEGNIVERKLEMDWILDTLTKPEHVEDDPAGLHRRSAFRRIEAFGGRWLRVVYDEVGEELEVVTAFFDRRARRRL